MLPSFSFDGETETVITASKNSLTVDYLNHTCQYTSSGKITDTTQIGENRNGSYRIFTAEGNGSLTVTVALS